MKRSRRSYKYFSLLWALIKTQNIGFFFKKYALIPRVGINTTAETQTNEILSVDHSIDDYKNTTAKRISKQRAEFLDKKKKKTSYFHKKALKRLINITGTPATGVESVYYQKYLRRFSTKFLFQRGKLQLAGFLRGTFKYNYLSKKNSYVYETKFPQPKIEPAGPGDTWTLKINLLHLFLNSITKANLGYTTSWAFVSLNQQLVADEQKTAYRQLWSFRQLPGFRTNKKTFLFWYTKFFILRDPKELSLLISFWLVKTQIKTHKKIFFDIFGGVDTLFSIGKKQNRLLGYFLYFKGKLAKKGSVRKEKIFKKCGKIAAGTKSVRGNIVQYQAPTLTGTIGCAIGLFFKSMLTLSLLYMFSYTVTLSLLCVYLYVHSLVKTTANLSLTNLFYLIFKFHDTRSIFFILLGQLSGVAPGIFFFLKLNLLIVGTNTAHIFTIIFIFFNLLTATFIYLQFLPTASHKLVNRSQLKQIAKPLIKKKNLTSFISAYSMVAFISLSVFGTLTITLGFIIIENVLL